MPNENDKCPKCELPTVAGRRLQGSNSDFERAVLVQLMHYQNQPNADSAMIHVLCEAVRCVREYSDAMNGLRLTTLEAENAKLREALKSLIDTYEAHDVSVENCDRSERTDDCIERCIFRASALLEKKGTKE